VKLESLSAPWRAAFEEAWRAMCAGSIPIGACVARGEEVVARGRNRIADPYSIDEYISGTKVSHAELNALVQLPESMPTHDLTLYSTLEPCPLCVGALVMSNIRTVTFAGGDAWAGSTQLLENNEYLRSKKTRVLPNPHPAMDDVSLIWLCLWELEYNSDLAQNAVLKRYQQRHPRVFVVARDLFNERVFEALRERRADWLEATALTLDRLQTLEGLSREKSFTL
jgi:tRNA(adenine34) deaminase